MRNERLLALMSAKGISKTTMAKMTGISSSTLSRIIENKIKHVKQNQMQAIASALGVTVHAVFDTSMESDTVTAIRPDEAGQPLTKLLSPDECLLLYWYQNSMQDGRERIFQCARAEYEKTLAYLHTHVMTEPEPEKEISFEHVAQQLSLVFPE